MDEKRGVFLAECRKNKKMTQEELGLLLNYSRNNISKWERGESFPSNPDTLTKLANILEVTFEELMFGEKRNKNNEEELMVFTDYIYDKWNIKLDKKWKYYINTLNSDDNFGFISFIYYIDENISTNKVINFFGDKGMISKVSFSYIDSKIDENLIINNVKLFKENTIQEKKKLNMNESFIEEGTKFSYNYRINKTIYSYYLFFKEGELINNDYGSEYIVEDFLKENNLS